MTFAAAVRSGGARSMPDPSDVSIRERIQQVKFPRPRTVSPDAQLKNFLFLVAGPSTAGKSTFAEFLRHDGIDIAIREFTRERRSDDDPSDLHVTRGDFEVRRQIGHYLFTYELPSPDAEGNQTTLYGFPRSNVSTLLERDIAMLLGNPQAIELTHAKLREANIPVVPMLITPDNPADLEERLTRRMDITSEEREARLASARTNYKNHRTFADKGLYTHVIINNNPIKLRAAWQRRGQAYAFSDKLVALCTTELSDAYARLSQAMAFYALNKSSLDPADPATVYRAFVDYCCRNLFGLDTEGMKVKQKEEGKVAFLKRQDIDSKYVAETYWVTSIKIPRRRKLVFGLNRKVLPDDVQRFDSFLRRAMSGDHEKLGYLRFEQTERKIMDRKLAISDRCYNHDWYASVTIQYAPEKPQKTTVSVTPSDQ